MISKEVSSILNTKTKITGSTIVKLLTIMSIDEIRKFFMSVVKNIFNYINERHLNILSWLNENILHNYFFNFIITIYNKIISFKKQEIKHHNELIIKNIPLESISINLKINDEIFDSIIKYMKNNKNVSYDVSKSKDVEIVNFKSMSISEIWSNIQINYQDVEIFIESPLTIKFTSGGTHTQITRIANTFDYIDETIEYNTILDLIPNAEIKKYLYDNCSATSYYLDNVFLWNYITKFIETDKSKSILNTYHSEIAPFKFKNIVYTLVIYFILISDKSQPNGQRILKNIVSRTKQHLIPPQTNKIRYHPFLLNVSYISRSDNDNITAMMNIPLITNFFEDSVKVTKPQDNNIINFTILGKDNKSSELYQIFNNFIKEITTYIEPTSNKKIKVNIIKIEKKIEVSSIKNPEYEQYEEQKENIIKLASKDKDDISVREFLLRTPPNKTISTTNIKKEVIVEEINEIYKSFDTLYLRNDDYEKLKKVLYNYLHQNELYDELGLPNKLNVFLSGLPGTGKTTIIQVIASYLQKNIYYCNISDDMTNDDIQMIFDNIIKKTAGGGIIVSEDVDAMTNIVHRRMKDSLSTISLSTADSTSLSSNDSSELSIFETQQTKDKSLTLSYLLNLLQGSLTQDGTIFIATTNHKEIIDPAFYRDGRFDVKIDMKLCDKYQINCIYKKFMKRDIPTDLLERIKDDEFEPAKVIFRVKDYIRSDCSDESILEPFLNK
jgi:hypothetical protein